MDGLKIGAAYIRVSTDDQTEYSPDSQLKLIRDYAKREGYLIPDEYVYQDEGISGKSASKRPAFRLMIATAKETPPPFTSIFVWKYSRFSRNQEEAIMYKNLLRKNGVSVVSISEPSSDGPFSSLIERIIEWMDEYYLINLSTEVHRGMVEKASRGEAPGNPPFGYSVANKRFVPNADADMVRWIFDRYNGGAGARKIAQELAQMGIKTPRGNLPDNRWVNYILGNPTYIGKIRYSTEGHANYARANYTGENVMIVDGLHDPIIDQETFDKAQERLKRPTETKYVRNNKIYMLKGLIRCSCCGSALVGSERSGGYQCHKYAKGQCAESHYISFAKAHAAALDALESVVGAGTYRFEPRKQESKRPALDWDKLIAAEEERLKRARNALLDGVFTNEEYAEARAYHDDVIAKLQEEKEAWEKQDAPDTQKCEAQVIKIMDVMRSEDVSERTKNEALRSVISKIVFDRKDERMDFYFFT